MSSIPVENAVTSSTAVRSDAIIPQKTVMAVAVRNNDVEGFEHLNLSIYFYIFGQTSIVTQSAKQPMQLTQTKLSEEFKRHKNLTIRATQGNNYLAAVETSVKDLKEGRDFSEYVQQNKQSRLNPQAAQVSSEKVTFYDRYISKMVFSRDEKFIAYILKNGLR